VSKSASAQLALGIGLLLLGTAVYLIDRPPGVFVPNALSLFERPEDVFGVLGRSLPSFAHVLAFSLFSAVIVGGGRQAAVTICLSWLLLEAGFELGQHATVAPVLTGLLPTWFEHIPILATTPDYFIYGSFDARDLWASALGALTAYLLIRHAHRRQERS
jgi:hypothetical protein